MLTERDLRELLDLKPKHPVLSIYLNTEPSQGNADVYKLKLRSMLKEVDLPEDTSAIENYIDHQHNGSGRSVAIFSCAAEDFFRAYPIQIPIRSRLRVSNRPHVKPLANLLDAYGRYGVALVDKQGARLFFFHLGALREQEGVLGESVRRTKKGGGSQMGGRRSGDGGQAQYTAEVTERNMRESAEFAAKFFAENNIRRVLIGGTDDNISLFRNHLSKSWQSLIVGTFPMSMTASHDDVMERAMKIGQKAEQKREAQIVETVITAAAKDRGGVIGLDKTLSMVHEGRIQSLLVLESFRAPGYRCLGCGYLTSEKLDSCPFCSDNFEEIPDAVDLAVRRVLEEGGEVDVLHENPKLEEHGQIGALLRY
jgi:peptide subunit release factor 1 (eRF1)